MKIRPLLAIFLVLLTACSGYVSAGQPTPAVPLVQPTDVVVAQLPTATVPPPTATATATITPEPSPTLTPTATLHPMMIEALRQTPYPGSDIVIEREFERGANYRRYYAYYLSEGLKIYGLLTIPDGEPPEGGWPAIIFNHGYIPPDVYRTTERYVAYVDGFASRGYIVYRIDYRGHDQSEGEPSGAYGDSGYLADVLNAVGAIKRFPSANPNKIGMWGHSMGGYLTLRAMVISPDIKAGVIWAGVVGSYPDLVYRWRRNNNGPTPTPPATARRWRDRWIQEFGPPEQNPAFWNAVSSNTYVGEVSGPIQLHHGTLDESVPLEFSEILAGQLQAAGKPYELYIYPDDNHNLSNYFVTAMQRSVEYFDRYLK